MSMLLLSLLQATPALDADPYQAGLICRAAIQAAGHGSLRRAAQYSYFTVAAARAMSGTTTYSERMEALTRVAAPASVTAPNAEALLDACDQRFPLARRTRVTLPADAFERDLLCATATSFFAGLARGYQRHEGDGAPYVRARALAERFQGRLDPQFAARGVTSIEAQRRTIDETMYAALETGNFEAITGACEALPAD
jgi:hypothetical protein